MSLRLTRPRWLKSGVLCIPLLFFMPEILSQTSFCVSGNGEAVAALLKQFKEKFHAELKAHYDSLSLSESEKNRYLEEYKNPDISVCSNPHDTSQKIVYIEYEKNWWGSLYFAIVKDSKILKWIKMETYGATTKYVRWDDKKIFFYEDSTHMGTKTQNTCFIQESSVACKKIQ